MDAHAPSSLLDLSTRTRRSKGRTGRTFSATAKVNRNELAELEAAAISETKGLSEWCRETLLASARGETVTPTFTEIVAIRQLLNATLRSLACGDTMTPEAFQKELQTIRSSKHKAAAEVMQQYAEIGGTR